MKQDQEKDERMWQEGFQAAMRRVLALAMTELPRHDMEKAHLLKERSETVSKLRELCELHGDNDWQDNLYLPDVIEKHLGRHLGCASRGTGEDELNLQP
jgi:hypothetical protein